MAGQFNEDMGGRIHGIPDVSLQGFPRHSLGEDDVRLPRMAWHVLSKRSRKTGVAR